MIQLHEDYLLFETSSGETIPCSAEFLTLEIIGEAVDGFDREVLRQAAAAVLHYFKHDLGRISVSLADFSVALERVLRGFGLSVAWMEEIPKDRAVEKSDLTRLVSDSGEAFELAFFAQLRDEVRSKLNSSPRVLDFQGLRDCVKKLLRAKRWNCRCQELSDQIVEFLRECLSRERKAASCGLVVR